MTMRDAVSEIKSNESSFRTGHGQSSKNGDFTGRYEVGGVDRKRKRGLVGVTLGFNKFVDVTARINHRGRIQDDAAKFRAITDLKGRGIVK